jgi:hypothetical protein
VYIGEQDTWHGGPLYAAIVNKFRELGLAGATVLHGIEGYGANATVHTGRIEALFKNLPVIVETVDIPERIAIAKAALDEMIVEGLVTIHDVGATRYTKKS